MPASCPRSPLSSRTPARCARLPIALVASLVATLVACGEKSAPPKPGTPAPSAPAIPATRPPGSPEIAFDRTTHDFGVVAQNADLRTTFTLTNKGASRLHVSGVHGNCGCIVAPPGAMTVAAGVSTPLPVEFHTNTMAGVQKKWVQVASDDPMQPAAMLSLVVDVSGGVVVDPANFFFPLSLVGSSPTPVVYVKWKEGVGKPFRVTGAEVKDLDGTIDVKPWESLPWRGFALTFAFRAPPPVGPVSGHATIRTDSAERPTIEALVGGTVSGKVWVTQREVSFGVATQGKGSRLEVLVRGFDATVDLGDVTAKAERGLVVASASKSKAEKGAWTIEIRLPDDAPAGPIEDRVLVTTKVAGEESLAIAVTGAVTPAR